MVNTKHNFRPETENKIEENALLVVQLQNEIRNSKKIFFVKF